MGGKHQMEDRGGRKSLLASLELNPRAGAYVLLPSPMHGELAMNTCTIRGDRQQ